MAYVTSTGQLRRDITPSSQRYDISIRRLLLLSILLLALFLTNPANETQWDHLLNSFHFHRKRRQSRIYDGGDSVLGYIKQKMGWSDTQGTKEKLGSISLQFLGIELDIFKTTPSSASSSSTLNPSSSNRIFSEHKSQQRRGVTNFGLFILEKGWNGIWMEVFGERLQICKFDEFYMEASLEGDFCKLIEKQACHEMKPFSPRHRPYTVHCVLAWFFLGNYFLWLCCPSGLARYYSRQNKIVSIRAPAACMENILRRPLDVILSVVCVVPPMSSLFGAFPLKEFVWLSAVVYNTLLQLHRIISVRLPEEEISVHFFIYATAILGLAGGLANLAASFLSSRETRLQRGFQGAVASCLGCSLSFTSGTGDLNVWGVQMLYGEALLLFLIWEGIRGGGKEGFASVVKVIVGGLLGMVIGSYCNERYVLGLSRFLYW